jgi:hypothetical protein
MKEPEHISYFSAHHANCRQAASYTPGLKNSQHTAPNFVRPQANTTNPLPGAAEHNPPMADTTVGNLAADNHRKRFGQEGWGAKSEGLVEVLYSHPTKSFSYTNNLPIC